MVVAFYFRLHLAYFPRPVVAIFARPEQNAENHIFKDILDWNTFEDATEPELQNYDYHRSRNAFILAQRQIQILERMLVKWPESEKAKAWLNTWACRLKQIPEKL